jgi:hypothetical protein
MHPEVVSDKPGKCPKCGSMDLVKVPDSANHDKQIANQSRFFVKYKPILIVLSLILLVALVITWQHYSNHPELSRKSVIHMFMTSFMAGYFLVFAGFKLLDIRGFANGFSQYDVIAKRLPGYALLYPFIELAFGLAYTANVYPLLTNYVVLLVMLVSGLGVYLKLRQKFRIQCACLGSVINLPLSNFTLVENLGMAAMALGMIVFII